MTLYYYFRDRIPFILTLLYFSRSRFRKSHLEFIGQYILSVTGMFTLISIILMIAGTSLKSLIGFWSYPSPIEWGILIVAGSHTLQKKRIPVFDSVYLSLLAGVGGGCLYEILYGIPYWIRSGFAPWNLFNSRLLKVFYVDFQVLALPVLFWILSERFNYRPSERTMIIFPFMLSFYLFGIQIAPFFHRLGNFGGNGVYGWVLRIPMAVILYQVLSEVKNNE